VILCKGKALDSLIGYEYHNEKLRINRNIKGKYWGGCNFNGWKWYI
jgi:hypothetical protein